MKQYVNIFGALILAGAMGTASIAAAGPIARFDNGYLDEHPEVAAQLGRDPRLVDNPQFLATHPGLDEYFKNHPEVRQDLQQHPYRFMSDEWRYDHFGEHGYGITRGELGRFDNGYLDQHPEVAEQLGRDPRLVDNPQFLATHPGLDEYFKNHPEIREELQHHPDRFMAREHYYEHPYKYMAAQRHYDQKH